MCDTTETTCNGWSNYATWRINLELADDYIDMLVQDDEAAAASVSELADRIQEYVETMVEDFDGKPVPPLTLAYAQAFIGQVNYWEIAKTAVADNPQLIEAQSEDAD